MSKSTNEQLHFKRRMKERFNIDVSDELYNQMILTIQSKLSEPNIQAEHVAKESNNRMMYQMKYNDISFTAIYDKKRHKLVTAFSTYSGG